MISRRRFLSIGGAVVSGLGFASSQEPELGSSEEVQIRGKLANGKKARIKKSIKDFAEKYSLPGISLAFAFQGQLKMTACFGMADVDTKASVQPHHLFRVASVSKPITSLAIMKLIEQKKMSLNDKVLGKDAWLTKLYDLKSHRDANNRRKLEQMTVGHLLEHTAGGWGNRRFDPMFRAATLGLEHKELIRRTIDDLPLARNPGEAYDYSNFGYCLLGRVIEAVCGKDYEASVREAILKPAGVRNMSVALKQRKKKLKHEVTYYQPGGNPYSLGMDVARMDAHGGWVSSPSELLKLLVHADGFSRPKDLLNSHSIQLMTRPTLKSSRYAKGWSVNASNNWWHQGSLPGGSSLLARIHDGHCWAVTINQRSRKKNYGLDLDRLPWSIRKEVGRWEKGDLFS